MRCASGGIIRSSVVTMYQLGVDRHAAVFTLPSSASTPHATWDAAMNDALLASTSPANDAWNLALSRKRKPSTGGRIGGTGAPGAGFWMSVFTDSPSLGANAAM